MLHLFPPSSLDNSILTSVLLGVMVVWFFQETLGWNFTGLVVPGYLGSILVIQPSTGLVILAEAIVTWLVFTALSDRIPRWWPWSPLFGRDRFFGILLVSVAVRIVLEGGGFSWIQHTFGIAVDTELHSMSLVVVPLAANALWRTGFLAALTRIGVPVVLTWALLELVLLRATNLSLSSFELTYEDLALDFVSSPRAYILLLTGAWLGSSANLRWGWDYGGIIVPGLLSVCWLEPITLLATLGEAAVIALLVRWLLHVPVLRSANLTGGRPLVLAFLVGYATKFLLGWSFAEMWPGLEVRALFGFGYLLPTMIALRVLRAGNDPFRPIVPAVVTSLAGFGFGSAIGYAFAVLLPARGPALAPAPPVERADVALAVLGWADRGPVPAVGKLLRTPGADGLVGGGDGFGALWIRPAGRELAISGQVGAAGMPAALRTFADAMDARVVLLCAERGDACDAARSSLARRMPVLLVEAADHTALRVAGRLPEAIRTAALSELIGPVPIESGEGPTVLLLSTGARFEAAARATGRTPGPLDADRLGAPLLPAAAPDEVTVRVMVEEVFGSWMEWVAREPWAEDALRVAAGTASQLGMGITATGDRSALVGPGFRVIVDRGGAGIVLSVTQEASGERTLGVGRAFASALQASALIEDAPPSLVGRDTQRADRPAHAALIGVLEALGPKARVVTLKMTPESRDTGADLVFSLGRPMWGADDAGSDLPAVASALGVTWAPLDGSYARAWCQDPDNLAREVAMVASGDDRAHVTLFAGPVARSRLGGGDRARGLVTSGALGIATRDLGEEVARRSPSPPGPEWDAVRTVAHAVTTTGELRELRALQRTARGPVVAVRDPVLGTRWLSVRACPGPECDELLTPLAGPCAACSPLPHVTGTLALGSADLVLRRATP